MKKFYLIIVVFLCVFTANAEISRLDSIKTKVMHFLVEKEDYYYYEDISEFPNVLIKNIKTWSPISENPYGIYYFEAFSEYAHAHILLVGEKEYKLLNMRDSLEENLLTIIDFLRRNEYSKEETIFYIERILKLQIFNRRAIQK